MPNTISEVRSSLLPGFRFHATDEERLLLYLKPRILGQPDQHHCEIIPNIRAFDLEPLELTSQYGHMFGYKEVFLFCQLQRKYSSGDRSNRRTKAGYWKQTGGRCSIKKEDTGEMIGFKKKLEFYEGRSMQEGKMTDWVMHEYHLNPECLGDDYDKKEIVACQIKRKKGKKPEMNPAPSPVNQEGDHSTYDNNPNNAAADNHNAVDAQSERSFQECMEGLPDFQSLSGFPDSNNTPAYQPQAGPEEGSSSLFDLSYDKDGNGLDYPYSNPAINPSFDWLYYDV
ncbi:hypothetical protein BT93_A0134 [Corymbia citriodora subsp. variegata]|nr:hypothetical protein BT93_A0134 [Corymbia citriodora subsp. variegata]